MKCLFQQPHKGLTNLSLPKTGFQPMRKRSPQPVLHFLNMPSRRMDEPLCKSSHPIPELYFLTSINPSPSTPRLQLGSAEHHHRSDSRHRKRQPSSRSETIDCKVIAENHLTEEYPSVSFSSHTRAVWWRCGGGRHTAASSALQFLVPCIRISE